MLPLHLRALLKRVSRSFYLSVRVLPAPVQEQVAIGYLLARAADTIADTTLLPASERLQLLAELRQAVRGQAQTRDRLVRRLRQAAGETAGPVTTASQSEATLLDSLADCLRCFDGLLAADRALVDSVLDKLILGMERDLGRFPAPAAGQLVPPSEVVALATQADLDEYTYYAAGCVGEFWTDLMALHLPALAPLAAPELRRRGVSLGKALQLVNVVRDAPSDLAAGRCYFPVELLRQHGMTPTRLGELAGQPGAASADEAAALRQINRSLVAWGRDLCQTAWPYVQAIPPAELRLRLACTWPLLLALDTLRALEAAGSPLLVGRPVKVTRRHVYGLLLRSSAAAVADRWQRHGSRHLDGLFRPDGP